MKKDNHMKYITAARVREIYNRRHFPLKRFVVRCQTAAMFEKTQKHMHTWGYTWGGQKDNFEVQALKDLGYSPPQALYFEERPDGSKSIEYCHFEYFASECKDYVDVPWTTAWVALNYLPTGLTREKNIHFNCGDEILDFIEIYHKTVKDINRKGKKK